MSPVASLSRRAQLLAKAVRREPLNLPEVAELCGTSKQRVWLIERRALRKLRNADPELFEILLRRR